MTSKFIITIVTLLLFYIASYSQDYLITKTLPVNDSIAFTTLRYGRKDYGFGVISSKGVMNWQVAVPGYPLGMGRFKNNVVVFYTFEDLQSLTALKDVHAALINLSDKKIIEDKVVYSNETKYQVDPSVLDDPAGNFIYLLIRATPLRGGIASMANNADTKLNETTQLSVISLGADLTTQIKDFKSIAVGSTFVGATSGINNDIYVCSISDEGLVTEKFDKDGNLKGKLAVEVPIRNKSKFYPVIKYDSLAGNCVDIAIAYKNNHKDDVLRSFRFNFNDQKGTSSEEAVLNKDYVKQLGHAEDEKTRLSNFKSIDDLYPVQLVETNDKVIVLKEIQYHFIPSGSNAEQFYRDGSIISIYTKKDLHLERDVIIDKSFGTFIMGGTAICSYMKNGKLYTVTCELSGPGKTKTYLYTINIDDGAMQKKVLEREDAGKGWITDPTTILWFTDNFITPFNSEKAFIHLKFETDLQSVNY
jgi:hypothetical protein